MVEVLTCVKEFRDMGIQVNLCCLPVSPVLKKTSYSSTDLPPLHVSRTLPRKTNSSSSGEPTSPGKMNKNNVSPEIKPSEPAK